MKNYWTFFSVFFLLFGWISQGVSAQNTNRHQKDSLWHAFSLAEGMEKEKTYNLLTQLYRYDVQKARVIDTILSLHDEMEALAKKEENRSLRGVIRVKRLFDIAEVDPDEAIRQIPASLQFLAENELWARYNQLYDFLINIYRKKGEYGKALVESKKFYEEARSHSDRKGMGTALSVMAILYDREKRFVESEECLRESILLLQGEPASLGTLATAHTRLATCLIEQGRYTEALQVAAETEKVNCRYEEASGSPHPKVWHNLWMCYVDMYRRMKDPDLALRYIDKVDSLSEGTANMDKQRGHVLYLKKQYREALELFDRAIEAAPNSREAEKLKLMTLIQMGESEEACQLLKKVLIKQESFYNLEYNAQLDELRTFYKVDKLTAEKKRQRDYFLFTLWSCILLALLLGVTFHYYRVTTAKNRSLYRQIREQDRLQEEIARIKQDKEKPIQRAARADTGEAEEAAETLLAHGQQQELVARLGEYLLSAGTLSDADLNREELVSALGTNKNILSKAVKAVTGKTPMEYIRFLQLEEARRMIDRHPELTIETIVTYSGFNTSNTFYRLFRKNYGITPAQYREMASFREN